MINEQTAGENRNLKKEFQFFATPDDLADRMVELANLHSGDRVLEPSAGRGAIIQAINRKYPEMSVECFEPMPVNRMILENINSAILIGDDFLKLNQQKEYANCEFDTIIANPPFSKNQDIDHIRAMYDCLKPGGRIVTIASLSWTFGSQKKQVEFRNWLRELGAEEHQLPVGTFSESGTEVPAMLLIIDKVIEQLTPFDGEPRSCRKCGCTDDHACPGGCHWVAPDLCSECLTHDDDLKVQPVTATLQKTTNTTQMKKITIPASPLLAVLKKVKEVISKHPTLDILSNVLVKVRRTDIQLVATDLMVTLEGTIDVENLGEKGYEFLLPFDFLYNVVQLINGLPLTVEVVGKKNSHAATLTTLNDNFVIDELGNTADFPVMPEFPTENSVGVSGDFINWLNRAVDTVYEDGLRPAMQKIYVGIANLGLSIASTNAHVIFEKCFETESLRTADLLISTKIAKALKGFSETSVSWSATHLALVSSNMRIIGTIQDETYPSYRAAFPEVTGNMKVLLSELTGVMEKVALAKAPATMYLKREIGIIVVEALDTNYNRKITVRIGADYNGDCEQVIVNPEMLLKLLNQIEYQSITLAITEASKPIVITTESDPSYRSLIAPMIN